MERKRRELDEAIALLSGLWMDATADKYAMAAGRTFKVTRTILDRETVAMQAEGKTCRTIRPSRLADPVHIAPGSPTRSRTG